MGNVLLLWHGTATFILVAGSDCIPITSTLCFLGFCGTVSSEIQYLFTKSAANAPVTCCVCFTQQSQAPAGRHIKIMVTSQNLSPLSLQSGREHIQPDKQQCCCCLFVHCSRSQSLS